MKEVLPETHSISELDGSLARVEEAFQRFLDALGGITPEEFAWQPPDVGPGLKRLLEQAADTNNFTYAAVVAKARNLGNLRCIATANFNNPFEAIMTLRVSHRRVLNQIAGITAEQFQHVVSQPPLGETTVRDMLMTMAQAYDEHAAQARGIRHAYKGNA